MNPIVMLTVIVVLVAIFAFSASRRWKLLQVGRPENRFDNIGERINRTLIYAFGQKKMGYYPLAGFAHKLIFAGFMVLLLRTLILWGRGFDPSFNLFILGDTNILGQTYEFLKDVFASLVVFGATVFIYYRVVNPQKRMTLSVEGVVILGIIVTMMLSDMAYDGAAIVLRHHYEGVCTGASGPEICGTVAKIVAPFSSPLSENVSFSFWPAPAGSLFAVIFSKLDLSTGALSFIAQAGFWTHATLVLVFLNLLPHSKHFHIITAIPNVFHSDINPRGRLAPMAENTEQLMEIVGAAAEKEDPLADPIGVARIEHVSWKAILDFYTCTECGRCSDNCPAHMTGKLLSPKHLTLDLRNHLYNREDEVLALPKKGQGNGAPAEASGEEDGASEEAAANGASNGAANGMTLGLKPVDLVPDVIHPDVIWGCTTCRACEEQCPVMISYVDKIVDMRRNVVLVKGEFPFELQKPFEGMEINGNPWNLARMDRAGWSDGLGIPMMAENPQAPVLFWVGCAASYDDRAKRIARATAKLMQQAGVDFAILGEEETCTGDPARRAGNEFLFAMLAEQNAETLNSYKEQGGIKKIVSTCPHCFNTLLNEYPDFGAKFEVVHHADFLMGLIAEKKLTPTKPVKGKVVFHDSCYLGRYNDIYESPRDILRSIPGVELVEAEMTRSRGLCCGAGGAQMFMEEQNKNRVNVKRTLQLIDTQAKTIASGCPFCMTMLTDGLKDQSMEGQIRQLDVAELLEESCVEVPLSTPEVEKVPAQASAD